MIVKTTNTMTTFNNASQILTLELSKSERSSIEVLWKLSAQIPPSVLGYRVHYQKVASSYIQYGPRLPSTVHAYTVNNLVADTYYKFCVSMFRNNTSPSQKCITAATQSWDLPVSVGSSIGAILALAMIVLLILLIRCRSMLLCKRKKEDSTKYDSVGANCNDVLYDFNVAHTEDADERHNKANLGDNAKKHIAKADKRHRQSASGAIPKVKKTEHTGQNSCKQKCDCHDKHGDEIKSNGYIRKQGSRQVSQDYDHYHDNAVILHVNGDGNHGQTKEIPNITPKTNMSTMKKLLRDNSEDIKVHSINQLDLFLTFPNADSSSESTDDIEMKNTSDMCQDTTIDSSAMSDYLESHLNDDFTNEKTPI